MAGEDNPYSFISFTHTATDDNPFRLVTVSIPMYEVNIHCFLKKANYGNLAEQNGEINVGEIPYFPNVDLKDIWFKNNNAGDNTKIVAIGSVPVKAIKQYLRL